MSTSEAAYAMQLQVETPLRSSELRSRTLPADTSRLLIRARSANGPDTSLLATIIWQLVEPMTSFCVIAEGAFVDFESRSRPAAYRCDKINRKTQLIEVQDVQAISELFGNWHAESLTILQLEKDRAIEVTRCAHQKVPIWRLDRRSMERRYLDCLRSSVPYMNFSSSHASIEVLGTKSQITRLIRPARDRLFPV